MKNIILFLILFISSRFLCGQTAIAPSLGDGTESNPYQIATLDNLFWLAAPDSIVPGPARSDRWSSNYVQTADINASPTSTWFPNGSGGYYGWIPIGDIKIFFSGSYDGQGHTVSGIYINRFENYIGFFGITGSGLISNLGLLNVNVSGRDNVGGFIGHNVSTINCCYTTGIVKGYRFAGGFVGLNGLSINKSYSTCTLYCGGGGGFVGSSIRVSINNCYSRGNIIISHNFPELYEKGGFAAVNAGTTIDYCYSTGCVTIDDNIPFLFTNVGFVGYNNIGIYIGNFWDTLTSIQSGTGGIAEQFATGKLTSEMKNYSTFTLAGWDVSVWNIDPAINDGYPYLKWQNPSGTALPVQLSSFTAITSNAGTVQLNWKTETEINSNSFIVQRKLIPSDWEPIGSLKASGLSNSPKKYSFNDINLQSGLYNYRLKMIDNDGSFKFSTIIETEIVLPKDYVLKHNYPNPFNPNTVISYSLPSASNVKLIVYNALGQTISTLENGFKTAGNYSINFNASNLTSGIYFYKLEAGQFSQIKKMILLK